MRGSQLHIGTAARWALRIGLPIGLLLISVTAVWALVTDLSLVGALHQPEAEHVEQADLMALVTNGESAAAFETAFETGDELFETNFNALDGVGANVGQGQRFTRVPRADLAGPGEWANHSPARATGPNAEACAACHNTPVDDGAGLAASNVHRDPLHTGNLSMFIQRNTPHTFAMGAVQRLAEEMTEQLHRLRDQATQQACQTHQPVTQSLAAKGISFGAIVVTPSSSEPCTVNVDTGGVQGVDPDLVIRPFQWKGSVAFVRAFNRDAAHNELGMQAVEIVGDGVDGDFDGVADEMSVGDHTALAIYLAAQPRPTSRLELSELGLIDRLSHQEAQAINRGKRIFSAIGCAACHTPQLRLNDPTFSEPSQNPNYRDAVFPAGQDPLAKGVDPAHPITFDLTRDQPDNVIVDKHGRVVYRLGSLRADHSGRAIVELYGDLKRHDLGPEMAEPIDEVGTGASVFLTENLWGVGSTAPYLHDGRATTLTEAILEHGGEAAAARDAFRALSSKDQARLIAFLNNLVLFKLAE